MFNKFILLLVCAVSMTAAFAPKPHIYKTVGGVKVELDVWIPTGSAPAGGYPVFFAIHGGGDYQGGKRGAWTGKELTEIMRRNWAIVSINYRMFPGVFLEDIDQDLQDAYRFMRTELTKIYPLNINLVTVFGQSAGGGLAALSGYRLSPRPQAIIAMYPFFTNWTDPYAYNPNTPVDPKIVAAVSKFSAPIVTEYYPTNATDPRSILWLNTLISNKMGWLATTHDPNLPSAQILAKLKKFSTTENMDKNYPPIYLAHGMADTAVPYAQSVQLASKLKEYNIPYALDLVPGAKHSFDLDPVYWQQHVFPAFEFAQKYMQSSSTNMKFLEK